MVSDAVLTDGELDYLEWDYDTVFVLYLVGTLALVAVTVHACKAPGDIVRLFSRNSGEDKGLDLGRLCSRDGPFR